MRISVLLSYLRFFILSPSFIFFFFNDTATTEIYTLSLHDALPILDEQAFHVAVHGVLFHFARVVRHVVRSEEHTSELQSRLHLVCRLLLEKKKKKSRRYHRITC